VSIDYPIWTNNSCNPIYPNGTSITGDTAAGAKGCSLGSYPVYVVNATLPSQIRTALLWAKERNIRIVVKNTGHSYSGRSTGYGSLSIWTRHVRGIEYMSAFQPSSCLANESYTAVRVAAGHAAIEAQLAVSKHNRVVITGANPDVGLVGWLLGGGHGPLTQSYGMGVDQLLQATLVTLTGDILTASACENTELFYALRGGGGGTFGVVTEVVVRTYPSPKTTRHTFSVSSLASTSSAEFYAFVAYLHADLQRLKEGGMQGYYYIGGPPLVPALGFMWTFMLFDAAPGSVEKLMEPILKYLESQKSLFTWAQETTHADTYLAIYNGTYTNEPVAMGGSAIGSRLLQAESLRDEARTARLLAEIGPNDDDDENVRSSFHPSPPWRLTKHHSPTPS
jgi:FAD/FMN-containing dehydrogenase